MTLQLQEGKRYRRRDGRETGPLVGRPSSQTYPFDDPWAGIDCVYRSDGRYWSHNEEPEDLIEEIHDQSAQPKGRKIVALYVGKGLAALCDDGTAWELCSDTTGADFWKQLPAIPQD